MNAEEYFNKNMTEFAHSFHLHNGVTMKGSSIWDFADAFSSHQTLDLTKENTWLKEEIKKMQDSMTSCQGELEALQNEHRKLREAVDVVMNEDPYITESNLVVKMAHAAGLVENNDGAWVLREQEDSHD